MLEEGNQGLSLAVNNHFYTITTLEEEIGESDGKVIINVHSPQLKSKWSYNYNQKDGKIEEINKQINVFV